MSTTAAVPTFERLIELVRRWSGQVRWEATWALSTKIDRCRNVWPEDPEYPAARREAAKWQELQLERFDELDEINKLVETHDPELLGDVPERPLDPPFDTAAAIECGQRMKRLLGRLLARQKAPPDVAEGQVLGRTAVALGSRPDGPSAKPEDKETQAMVMIVNEKLKSKTAVAEFLGVHRTTIYRRCVTADSKDSLVKAMKQMGLHQEKDRSRLRTGHKSADGRAEAYAADPADD